MPFTVQHVKSVTVADATDTALVRPSDWNSTHAVTYSPTGQEIIGVFSNGGNVSFGTDPSGFITGSAPAGGGANYVFSNSNNVSFGTNGSTVTATATFAQTADTNKAGVGFTTTTTAGDVVAGTNDTNGLKLGVPAFLTTAMASNVGTNFVATSQSSLFQHTSATSAITTNAAHSTHSHGMVTTTTNGSLMTVAGNSGGYTLAVPPYVTAAAGGGDGYNIIGVNGGATSLSTTLQLSNANNVTFGLNAGTITASASYPAQTADTNKAGIGYTSTTQAGSTVGATHNTQGLSMAWPPFITTFNQTVQPAVAQLNGSSGTMSLAVGSSLSASTNGSTITLGLASNITTALQSAGAYLTTAALSQDSSKYAGTSTGFTGGASISGSFTHNTAGLAISLSHPAWLTTAALSQNTSNYAGTGTTFAGANISGSMTNNTNGLNLSLSVAAPGAAAENNWFSLGGNVAGNSTASGSTIQLIGGNNITLSGTNGSQIQIVGAAGGGAAPDRYFKEIIQGERLTTVLNYGTTNNSNRLQLMPFWMEGTGLQVNTARFLMSFGASSNRSLVMTLRVGLYSLTNSTQMTLLTSDSMTVNSTNTASSASWNGPAWMDFTNMRNFTCTKEGRYMIGIACQPGAANTASCPVTLYGADPMPVQSRVWSNGATSAMNNTYQFIPFWGAYSATTTGIPNAIGLSEVYGTASASQIQYYCAIKEI